MSDLVKTSKERISGNKAHMSYVMRKQAFSISENKGADQLHGNHAADRGFCYRYIDSTAPLLPKSEISNL